MGKASWYLNRFKSYVARPKVVVQERAIILSEEDVCESPIFILGVHRSGTSLVRRMFNSHPHIAAPPETFFIEHYCNMFKDDMTWSGYEGFGYTRDEMRVDIARKASRLHEAYRVAQGKTVWADKTPQYVFRADDIDELFGRMARFVVILRHPCDISFSIYNRGWKFNDHDDRFEGTLLYVKNGISELISFASRHQERLATIIYEDLVADPARTLTIAMAKIGMEYSDEMLKFGNKSHNFGLEDPVIRGKASIEGSHGAWRSWSGDRIARARLHFGDAIDEVNYWDSADRSVFSV